MYARFVTIALACAGAVLASCAAGDPIIAHEGKPVGQLKTYKNVTLYVTAPPAHLPPRAQTAKPDVALLFLTDVFGIQLNEAKLLADSFARAGYLTVAPDLFNGKPAPMDLNDPNFNVTEFLATHGPDVADPIIAKALDYLHSVPSVKTVVTTGYCYGGRYAMRLVGTRNATVAFTAHPSAWEPSEVLAINGPVSIAAAENDSFMPPEVRAQIEGLLQNSTQGYQVDLYSGTQHGFGVRVNISNPWEKFGKETAFYQALRWFDTWA